MLQGGLLSFRPTEVVLTQERKFQKYEAKLSVFIFFECVKIIFGGLTQQTMLQRNGYCS